MYFISSMCINLNIRRIIYIYIYIHMIMQFVKICERRMKRLYSKIKIL